MSAPESSAAPDDPRPAGAAAGVGPDADAPAITDGPAGGAGAPVLPDVALDAGLPRRAVEAHAAYATLRVALLVLAAGFGMGVPVCWFTGQTAIGWLCLAMVAVTSGQLLLLRRGVRARRIADTFLGELFLVFALVTVGSGGDQITFVYLGMLLVLFAVFIRDVRVGSLMAVASVVVLIGTHLLLELGFEPWLRPDSEAVSVGKFYGGSILTLATLGIMWQHARARDQALKAARDAERQRHRLVAEKRDLAREYERLRTLAGGVAHDFNNVLQTIVGRAQLAEGLEPDEARRHLDGVQLAARRAAGIVDNLLMFAGRAGTRPQRMDLGVLLEEVAMLAEPLLSPDVRLVRDVQHGLWADGDAGQLTSLWINLVHNALQAMGDAGGTLRLAARRRDVDPAGLSGCVSGAELPAGEYIELVVGDDGPGIPAAIRERVFDPFFTTRPAGHGLGLATAPAIAEGHAGALCLESEVGRGTTLRLLLPAREAPDAADDEAHGDGLAGRRVLLADDEAAVREVNTAILESAGVEVFAEADGELALERHATLDGAVDLALLDLDMPGPDGWAVAAELRRRDPSLPVVILSGYWAGDDDDTPWVVLQKPLTRDELLAAVGAALEGRPRR